MKKQYRFRDDDTIEESAAKIFLQIEELEKHVKRLLFLSAWLPGLFVWNPFDPENTEHMGRVASAQTGRFILDLQMVLDSLKKKKGITKILEIKRKILIKRYELAIGKLKKKDNKYMEFVMAKELIIGEGVKHERTR